jgi:toxin FitB
LTGSAEPSRVLLDTSIAVALLVKDHEAHSVCRAAIRGLDLGLAGHAIFETMSVISRLPGSSRRSTSLVLRAVTESFPNSHYLSAERTRDVATAVADLGIGGGAVYDALVCAAAIEAGCRLMTRDTRALPTYQSLGAQIIVVT